MVSERAVGCIEGLGLATLIAKRTGANPKPFWIAWRASKFEPSLM